MLALGRGLMSQPELVLVDEPSLGLAPKAAAAVFDALCTLRQEGLTVLLVEQNVQRFKSAIAAMSSNRGVLFLKAQARDCLEMSMCVRRTLGVGTKWNDLQA
jgi:branched-chain amino acid transport system ATP-binding protein